MRRLRFEELTATAAVGAKLATKHGVRLEEVEETVFGRGVHIRKGQAGLYLMYGRTAAGRYLFCLIAAEESKARVVTARSMTPAERRFYGKQQGK
jgi:uncharacterized DUF497 family protein